MNNAASRLKKTVGSLLVLGFEGTQVTEFLKIFLEQWELGGVILFKRNIQSIQQLSDLNQTIDRLATKTPILSVDHEGGRVFRLPEPFTVFPPMRNLGDFCKKVGAIQGATEVGLTFARELRAVGFNLNYAPVLDVDSNPNNPIIGDRAFSSDPQDVAMFGLALAKGLMEGGVIPCGKHFPGHGDTSEDSHLALPKVEKTREALEACELFPFRSAIGHGIPMLMSAHVLYPALDPDWPATLSEKILTGILRKELGYQGLVISDDLFMKGIVLRWGLEEAAEQYLRAGGDLVLLCHEEAAQRRVAEYLVHRAENDSAFRLLLEEKAERMENFRKRLARSVVPEFLASVGSPQHLKLAKSFT